MQELFMLILISEVSVLDVPFLNGSLKYSTHRIALMENEYPMSPIESRNNTIKLLIRNAAGYRNFDHLRSRIIYCINTKKKES
jgi:hypothetical protein